MKQTFTKKDLLTGDIIEERNGDRGVVILKRTAFCTRLEALMNWISLPMTCLLTVPPGKEIFSGYTVIRTDLPASRNFMMHSLSFEGSITGQQGKGLRSLMQNMTQRRERH